VIQPLPALIVVTDAEGTGGRPLLEVVGAAIDGGARAVLLREKHRSRSQRQALAEALRAALAPVGGVLLVASDPTIVADGVHLAAADDYPRNPSGRGVGRSCHSAADLEAAAEQGCDYATLSPIFLTASKPGYGPALGTSSLAQPPLPTWALGGVDAGHARSCLDAGAAGVAVMGAIMRAEDPAAVTAALIRALA
jgi:thiamine-phosphate pyrophosphorylase